MPKIIAKLRFFLRFSEDADSQDEFLDIDTEEVVGIEYFAKRKCKCVAITIDEAKEHKWYPRLSEKYGMILDYTNVYLIVDARL